MLEQSKRISDLIMESLSTNSQPPVVICMPIYNDWEAALSLLKPIDGVAGREGIVFSVVGGRRLSGPATGKAA
jgi:hypothetical protein